jgi:hypothetical protein
MASLGPSDPLCGHSSARFDAMITYLFFLPEWLYREEFPSVML